MNEDLKISQLPEVTTLTGNEIIPIVIDSTNKSIKYATIDTRINTLITNAIGNSIAELDELNNMIV